MLVVLFSFEILDEELVTLTVFEHTCGHDIRYLVTQQLFLGRKKRGDQVLFSNLSWIYYIDAGTIFS